MYYDTESGFYYLQSRYYDPEIGRFINADSYVSTGQGYVGYNMFAYCSNSPANGCDPCGSCFHRWDVWNDCNRCGGKSLGEKWKEYYENALTIVCTVGAVASANVGAFNIAGSIEIAIDLKGNIQLVGSGSFDVTSSGGFSASVGGTGSIYFMPDVSYLTGDTDYLGGSVYVPNPAGACTVGIGGNLGITSDGYYGVNASLGIGTITAAGIDGHSGHTATSAITEKINVFECFGLYIN